MLSLQNFPIPPTINIRATNKPLIPLSTHPTHQSKIRCGPTDLNNPNACLSKFSLAGASERAPGEFDKENNDEIQLPEELKPELMPKHVAVIMDASGRWAKSNGLPVQLGHRVAGQAMKQLALNCKNFGVQAVTVFAFSTEN